MDRQGLINSKPQREQFHSIEEFEEAHNHWMSHQGRILAMTEKTRPSAFEQNIHQLIEETDAWKTPNILLERVRRKAPILEEKISQWASPPGIRIRMALFGRDSITFLSALAIITEFKIDPQFLGSKDMEEFLDLSVAYRVSWVRIRLELDGGKFNEAQETEQAFKDLREAVTAAKTFIAGMAQDHSTPDNALIDYIANRIPALIEGRSQFEIQLREFMKQTFRDWLPKAKRRPVAGIRLLSLGMFTGPAIFGFGTTSYIPTVLIWALFSSLIFIWQYRVEITEARRDKMHSRPAGIYGKASDISTLVVIIGGYVAAQSALYFAIRYLTH